MTEQELVFGILAKEAMARKLAADDLPRAANLAARMKERIRRAARYAGTARERAAGAFARHPRAAMAAKALAGLAGAGTAYKGGRALLARLRRKPSRMQRLKAKGRALLARLRRR